MSRKSLSLETKLAAALRLLLAIPYTDAKQMTAAQLCSLVQWHHDDPHAISGNDHHSNLRPLLIRAHRERTPADAATVRKSNRVRAKHQEHQGRVGMNTRWITRAEAERLYPSLPPPGVLVELAPLPKRTKQRMVIMRREITREELARAFPMSGKLRSRGFDKTKTRGFDGKVKPRKRRRK